jgi:hypothetical protein
VQGNCWSSDVSEAKVQTANELIDEIAKQPNADKFMDRDPANLADRDIEQLVSILRDERSRFKVKEQTGQTDDTDRVELGDVWAADVGEG